MDNKYKNGKIYTIRNRSNEALIYVGSTIGPLYKRFALHKSVSKKPEKENNNEKINNQIKGLQWDLANMTWDLDVKPV